MKKALVIIGIVILAIILFIFFAYAQLPNWISSDLSKRAQVKVKIEDIHLGTDQIRIDGVLVENPSNSRIKDALRVEEINIDTYYKNYFKEKIIIDEMALNDIFISLEFYAPNSTKGNWTIIINNLNSSNSKDAKDDKESKEVLIKRLILTDLKIAMFTHGVDKEVRHLSPIDRFEFTDISSKGGIPSAQIMNLVMQEALKQIFSKENIENMIRDLASPNQESQGFFNEIKDLFSQ